MEDKTYEFSVLFSLLSRIRKEELTEMIVLEYGYYIESDKHGYSLKQKYKGKTSAGEPKECVRKIGYFSELKQAVERYLKMVQEQNAGGVSLTMREYAEKIEESNKNAVWAIIQLIGGKDD